MSIHYDYILDLTHSEPLLNIFVHLIKMHATTRECLRIHYHSLHFEQLHSCCILLQRIHQHLECILHLLHTVTDAFSMHSMAHLHFVTFILIREECIMSTAFEGGHCITLHSDACEICRILYMLHFC